MCKKFKRKTISTEIVTIKNKYGHSVVYVRTVDSQRTTIHLSRISGPLVIIYSILTYLMFLAAHAVVPRRSLRSCLQRSHVT